MCQHRPWATLKTGVGRAFLKLSSKGREIAMPWVYSVGTVIIGLFFYWVRSNCRVWYGVSEILVAFALMYVAYFPHGGPFVFGVGGEGPRLAPKILGTVITQAVPFFAGVYALVRGLDNVEALERWNRVRAGRSAALRSATPSLTAMVRPSRGALTGFASSARTCSPPSPAGRSGSFVERARERATQSARLTIPTSESRRVSAGSPSLRDSLLRHRANRRQTAPSEERPRHSEFWRARRSHRPPRRSSWHRSGGDCALEMAGLNCSIPSRPTWH
jgi:hypothetical protein